MVKYPLKFDAERQEQFLRLMEDSGEVTACAAAVGVHRQTVYGAMQRDPAFKERVEIARMKLGQKALARAKHLAIDGVLETTYDKDGNVIKERRVYSTRLLLRLMERHFPEWGDKVQIDQTVSGEVEHVHSVKPRDLSRAARMKVRELLAELPDESAN